MFSNLRPITLDHVMLRDITAFVSGTGTCGLSAAPAPDGTNRHRTAPIGTDRPGLFYEVFDTHFVFNSPKRHDILKILIKYVIKQPGPVQSGQGRSVPVPVGAGAGTGSPRRRLVPTGAGAADRPQETL